MILFQKFRNSKPSSQNFAKIMTYRKSGKKKVFKKVLKKNVKNDMVG